MVRMDIVQKQLAAFNTKNLQAFLSCYAENIKVYLLESGQMITDGISQLESIMQKAFAENPKTSTEILSSINQGTLTVNHEAISADVPGKIIKAVSIYHLENGKITQLWFGGRFVENLKQK